MSKSLELKTFTIWESLGGTMYSGESAEDVVNVDYEVYRKRLTDAELAAEFHKAESDLMSANSIDLLFDDDLSADRLERARVWMFHMESFATLPHYDEDQP